MKKDLIKKVLFLVLAFGFLNATYAAECFNGNTGEPCINNVAAHTARAAK